MNIKNSLALSAALHFVSKDIPAGHQNIIDSIIKRISALSRRPINNQVFALRIAQTIEHFSVDAVNCNKMTEKFLSGGNVGYDSKYINELKFKQSKLLLDKYSDCAMRVAYIAASCANWGISEERADQLAGLIVQSIVATFWEDWTLKNRLEWVIKLMYIYSDLTEKRFTATIFPRLE